jgi:imidazolonepropionase-like amidohydrolase
MSRVVLINARLVGKPAARQYSIDIAGGVIVGVSRDRVVDVPDDAEVVDLKGKWVSPVSRVLCSLGEESQ